MKKFLVGSALLAFMIIGFVGCKQVTITGLQKTVPNSEDPISNVTYKIDSNGRLTGYKGNKPSGKIVLPNSVKSIGSSAFFGCSDLTSITIPDSVTWIGVYAFYGCDKITEIKVSTASTTYQGINGVLYSQDGTTLYKYPPAKQGISYTIPNSVTSIRGGAFSSCSGLTSITIPDSVTSIGDSAFVDCSRLTSVSIPNSVKSIGYSAFYGCDKITEIKVSTASTTYQGINGVLYSQDGTTLYKYPPAKQGISYTIPNSVTSIGGGAFSSCSGLASITIPDSVTSIGASAFSYCSGLTSVSIPNSVKSIKGGAFWGCSGLTSISIPNSVKSIEGSAFQFCSGLTSVSIPNSVTSIGAAAFYGCGGLTNISIPNSVTSIGYNAFDGCNKATIYVPNTTIQNLAKGKGVADNKIEVKTN